MRSVVFVGVAGGFTWGFIAHTAYQWGLARPELDPLGVVRAVVYLPLTLASLLKLSGVPGDVELIYFVGALLGLVGVIVTARFLRI
jgi:hypothetical protein